jgi:hypothetical protein
VGEVARQPVEHDCSAALGDREGVAPEPECEAERDRCRGQGVEPLARGVVMLPRHPDHDRVEGPVDLHRAPRDPAQQGLRMGDRGRPGERSHCRQLAREIVEQPAAEPRRQE